MSVEAIAGLLVAFGTLLGAVGGFLARSRLGDVMVSGSKREETAVETMAQALKQLTGGSQDRELKLIGLQEKALDTVGQMSGAIQAFTLALQAHEHDMLELGETGHGIASEILESIRSTQVDVKEMAAMLADLALSYRPMEDPAAGD